MRSTTNRRLLRILPHFIGTATLLNCTVYTTRIDPIRPIYGPDGSGSQIRENPIRADFVARTSKSALSAWDMKKALRNNPNILIQEDARILIRYSYEEENYSHSFLHTLSCLTLWIFPYKKITGGFIEFEIFDRQQNRVIGNYRYETRKTSHAGTLIPLASPFVYLARSLGLTRSFSARKNELRIFSQVAARFTRDLRYDHRMEKHQATFESGQSLSPRITLVQDFEGHPAGPKLAARMRTLMNKQRLAAIGPGDSNPQLAKHKTPGSILEGKIEIVRLYERTRSYRPYEDYVSLRFRLWNTTTGRVELEREYGFFLGRGPDSPKRFKYNQTWEEKFLRDLAWAKKSNNI